LFIALISTKLVAFLLAVPAAFCFLLAPDPIFTGDLPSAFPPPQQIENLTTSSLIYVSDYFSFVGADADGHVAFALDNNRGRDGDSFQAEHFVVLHDEQRGWISMAGNGAYENSGHELARIPDSPFFHFEGTPQSGLTVASEKNRLTLHIDPIPQRHRSESGKAVAWMGSAHAVLIWQGRTVPGRVIYEYLMIPDFNRLTHIYFGLWKEFQGLYLSADGTDDLYLHSQRSEKLAALVGKLVGFAVINERTDTLRDLDVEVLEREFALGFYRWPMRWRITARGDNGPAEMTLTLIRRKRIANWVIGGFSMGIVQGELSYNGRTWNLYGFAELLM
jgi:hypothetical protein